MCSLFFLLPLRAADDARLEFAFGVLEQSRGAAGANERFEAARLADPTALPLVRLAVDRKMKDGDRAGAIRIFRGFSKARAGDVRAQLAYADFLINVGGGDAGALKLIEESLVPLLEKDPGNVAVIRRLVEVARERGDDAAAVGWLKSLATDDAEAALLFGAQARSLNLADEAGMRYEAALMAEPGNAVLARAASDHFRRVGRMDDAVAALQRHIGAAPWSLGLRARAGVLLFAGKRHAEGEQVLKELLTIDPRHALAHQALAKYYRLEKREPEAAFHARELLKIRGGTVSEFLEFAKERLEAGDAREARLLLEKAVFDHPDDPRLRTTLAVATHKDPETRARAGRLFREAEAVLAGDVDPDPEFLTNSAEALIEAGHTKAGEDRLRSAIRAYSPEAKEETAAALRKLAELWQSEGRNADAAKALLKRAEALDGGARTPDSPGD